METYRVDIDIIDTIITMLEIVCYVYNFPSETIFVHMRNKICIKENESQSFSRKTALITQQSITVYRQW